eukprot:TRINITY_DN18023_c0_g1_i1.p1 TRINITY_DN18023_c0_g1~~TRINITY_DN18023_c0_g1_i1.p1  ORF type:complete len:175 (+),score=23.08 TRINITY_DN18023_c0_g1_i1:221-745(+)
MMAVPRRMQPNCFMASLGSVSLISSGSTDTRAILRNPPAENGKIHEVLASNDWTESKDKAAMAPSIPTLAVHIWAFPASHLENPLLRSIAKSPISCGISWIKMANVVMRPILKDVRKLLATASPCIKLSIQFCQKVEISNDLFLFSSPLLLFSLSFSSVNSKIFSNTRKVRIPP